MYVDLSGPIGPQECITKGRLKYVLLSPAHTGAHGCSKVRHAWAQRTSPPALGSRVSHPVSRAAEPQGRA